MMILALLIFALSGALAAVLVCKGIRLRLWADVLAGCGALLAMWLAGQLAGAEAWPLVGFLVGWVAVVSYLRTRRTT